MNDTLLSQCDKCEKVKPTEQLTSSQDGRVLCDNCYKSPEPTTEED